MTTREALLAEAAKHHAENWAIPNPLSDEAKDALAHAYSTGANWGATWEAQRSAVLLEALEKIGTPANQNPSESRDVLLFCEELARAALEKYNRRG